MTETELIAEVQNQFEEAHSMGEIDSITIVNAMIDGFQQAHGLSRERFTDLWEIKNYKVSKPKGFDKLIKVNEIEMIGYTEDDKCNPAKHSETFGFLNIICNNCTEYSHLHRDISVKKTTKNYKWGSVELNYRVSGELDVNINNLSNILRGSGDSITIGRDNINFPYKEGFLYVEYLGMPVYKGEFYIPETPRGDLRNFILNKALASVSKDLMIRTRDNFYVNLYQLYSEKENYFYNRASYESKLGSLYTKKAKEHNRAYDRTNRNKFK